jgi:DNA-binding MarR family transcriptional regulator
MADDDRAGLEAELFGSLFVLLQNLTHRADEELARFGLTSRQWLLLAVLSKWAPGAPPTLSEAAAAYGTSRQNVKQIAAQLARRGWLRLEADPADGRATRLVLTHQMSVFAEPEVVEQQAAFLHEVFSPLSARERRTLRDLVVRCLAHVAAPPAAAGAATRPSRRPTPTDARGEPS